MTKRICVNCKKKFQGFGIFCDKCLVKGKLWDLN